MSNKSLIYPKYVRADPIDCFNHPYTTPRPFFGTEDACSSWLKLEITHFAKGTDEDVEAWLVQVLTEAIGEKYAIRALELMKASARYGQFISAVREYLNDRDPKPRKRKKGRRRKGPGG